MAFCISRRGVFIFLILGLSFVHCSENDCEAFDDVDDVQYEKCEVTFEAEDLKESINCGQFVPLQKFKDTFDGTAPTVKYSNAVRFIIKVNLHLKALWWNHSVYKNHQGQLPGSTNLIYMN